MLTPNYRCYANFVAFWLIGSWRFFSSVTSLPLQAPAVSKSYALSLPCYFQQSSTATRSRSASLPINGASGNNQEPDLFDYFDPLLSPHAYPNGVSPNSKPLNAEEIPPVKTGYSGNPFGIDYMSQKRRGTDESSTPSTSSSSTSSSSKSTTKPTEPKRPGQDVFGFFDPLLSPHMYPNGVSAPPINSPPELQVDDRYNPLKMDTKIMSGSSSSKKKLGILLMDHGSRNAASNARLHHLAQLYQLTFGFPVDTESTEMSSRGEQECEIVVKAAHMEIATPTIPDGLKALVDLGVDEIICHPFFLSPGRHVTEDIPRIVNQAIGDLAIKIPVITTEPVGSNTQLMIGAIHSLVRENSNLLQTQKVR